MKAIDAFDLHGKTALVTGANLGIGRAIAVGLAQQGANLAIHYLGEREAAVEATGVVEAAGVKACLIEQDLSEHGAAQAVFERAVAGLGQVDILVLNVSVQIPRPWVEITSDQFEKQVTVNLKSQLELMQLAVPPMVKRGWGRVLNIGSVQQAIPSPAMLVYAATKDAQFSMVRNLARQVARSGVTVNTLAPGIIDTPRNQFERFSPQDMDKVLSWIPSRRIGHPEDCVGAALLLCSEAGRYINGVCLYVDGGMHLSTTNQ